MHVHMFSKFVTYVIALIMTFGYHVVRTADVTEFKIGVPLVGGFGSPYDIERAGPAIEMAFTEVNDNILNSSYRLVKLEQKYGNNCTGAPAVAAELYYKKGIIGLIGPACAMSLDPVARLAGYWNIPIVTGLGDGGEFKFKWNFPTMTRFSYCQCRLRKVFGSVFLHFNWTDISMIYDLNNPHSKVLAATLEKGLQKQKFYPKLFSYYNNEGTIDYKELLQRAAKETRVILLIVPGHDVRNFMLNALELGYVESGEFVFMDFELFPFPGNYYGNHDWHREDDVSETNEKAKRAYTALLRIALVEAASDEWIQFTKRVKSLAKDMYNFTYGSEKVNFFVGAFFDAVKVYGIILNETLTLGEDPTDGYNFTRRIWGRHYNGITGDVYIDNNGDRDTSYTIMDMNPDTGIFEVIANFEGKRQTYEPVPNKTIHWSGNRNVPPPNEPKCGFQGEKPICQTKAGLPDYVIVLASLMVTLIVLIIILTFGFRYYQKEKSIQNMTWRIAHKDIKSYNRANSAFSKLSMSHLGSEGDGNSVSNQIFTKVAVYKSQVVVMKNININKFDLNRKLILEFKEIHELQHTNLVRFIGACVDPGNTCFLTEYCKKGSLQDVLYNDDITLDWTFRLSLLKDISSGLMYIHGSSIKYHGRLSSSNCVVDGRFVVKLTDFGFTSIIKQSTLTEINTRKQHEKLLWKAPEVVRSTSTCDGSREADIYSFGIIMEEVSTRSGPYYMFSDSMDPTEIIARIISKEKPPFRPKIVSSECPEGVIELAEKCWVEDPCARPNIIGVQKLLKKMLGGKTTNLVDTLLRRMEQYAANLEHIVQDRTQQLMVEKRRSDELLYQILPRSVAEQLKEGNHVVPESYDSVSVYFSDIVGFTALSSDSTPFQIVDFLNDLYTLFDHTIENFSVYKVETIGDAYMVVSGLPIRNGRQHAPEICRLALKLLDQITNFKIRHKPEQTLELRIGIHSGPCVAGVVGLKMPRYCLFGDTVNTASRMESNGEARKVHISSSTKGLLDNYPSFNTEYRGQVLAKGKGLIDTFWLHGETISVSRVQV